ncbi:MAG: hypothetical protein VCC20_09980 [Myxococcota bacterium]
MEQVYGLGDDREASPGALGENELGAMWDRLHGYACVLDRPGHDRVVDVIDLDPEAVRGRFVGRVIFRVLEEHLPGERQAGERLGIGLVGRRLHADKATESVDREVDLREWQTLPVAPAVLDLESVSGPIRLETGVGEAVILVESQRDVGNL